MADRAIRVHGARTHNLKDVDVEIPREAWTVVCGVSGSGKTSLVLDTLGAESRRRLLGTLSRSDRWLDVVPRPDVDGIDGLPPAVVAGFGSRAPGPRETLGTVTEVTHALRALFLRLAVPHCPRCGSAVASRSREAVVADLLREPEGTRVVLLAPRGSGREALEQTVREGFVRVRVGRGDPERAEDVDASRLASGDRVDAVVDRLVVKHGGEDRFAASVEQGLRLGGGVLRARIERPDRSSREETFASRPFCGTCDVTYPALSTSLFSFGSPAGACPRCEGRGWVEPRRAEGAAKRASERRREEAPDRPPCPECGGARLAPFPRAARVAGRTFAELEALPAADLRAWLGELPVEDGEAALAGPAREDALARLAFLEEAGLGYLALGRGADTLSSGELRRARLTAACAARMSGLLFLLDEPTAGLHPADRPALRRRLRALVDEGHTLVCVEHDPATVRAADWLVELGPGAGDAGGHVLAAGAAREVLAVAATPMARAVAAEPPSPRSAPRQAGTSLVVERARWRNLRDVTASFPVPGLTCVTGVSGAGKTTLVLGVLAPAARAALEGLRVPKDRLGALRGASAFDRVSVASGAPPRHPRATPGSVLGALSSVRDVFAATLEARARGWGPARFSTNVPGGRCEACEGTAERAVALRDLPEVRVPCDTCGGRRFSAETERVRVKGLSIADVYGLTLERAAEVFRDLPGAGSALRAATDVGLGYVLVGEPTTRLSGGEALRLRLAAALGRGGRTRTLFLLDEPAAGLHPDDVAHLLGVLVRLAEAGNAVVAVDHHDRLVREADHVVELGPGPGEAGGRLLFEGPPADLLHVRDSPTARALRGEVG